MLINVVDLMGDPDLTRNVWNRTTKHAISALMTTTLNTTLTPSASFVNTTTLSTSTQQQMMLPLSARSLRIRIVKSKVRRAQLRKIRSETFVPLKYDVTFAPVSSKSQRLVDTKLVSDDLVEMNVEMSVHLFCNFSTRVMLFRSRAFKDINLQLVALLLTFVCIRSMISFDKQFGRVHIWSEVEAHRRQELEIRLDAAHARSDAYTQLLIQHKLRSEDACQLPELLESDERRRKHQTCCQHANADVNDLDSNNFIRAV
jgi:hypothetical protein